MTGEVEEMLQKYQQKYVRVVVDLFKICKLRVKPSLSVIENQKLASLLNQTLNLRVMIKSQLGTDNKDLNLKLKNT